jgi:hypothetical protein
VSYIGGWDGIVNCETENGLRKSQGISGSLFADRKGKMDDDYDKEKQIQ